MKKVMLVLLVAVMGCQVTMLAPNPQKEAKAQKKKAEAEITERIRQYRILHEEQQLIRDIMLIKLEMEKMQTEKNAPPQQVEAPRRPPNNPNIPTRIDEMEFIPIDEIPPDAKVSDGLGAPPN